MLIIGFILIYLAIVRDYEPLLLLPIGFGAILANIPLSSAVGPEGWRPRWRWWAPSCSATWSGSAACCSPG